MVREIDGGGRHYRDVMQRRSLLDINLRHVNFLQSDANEQERETSTLQTLKTLPDIWDESFLLVNVVDTERKPVHTLFVPQRCPFELTNSYRSSERDLPDENRTWLVKAWIRSSPSGAITHAVLADSEIPASRITRRNASIILGCFRQEIEIETRKVTVCEFLEHVFGEIDRDKPIPVFLLTYRVIGDYFEKHQREKAAQFTSVA